MANVYEITKDDLPRIPADRQGVKRFRTWVYAAPSIEVAKYDGSLQCEMGARVTGRNGEGAACCDDRRTGESQEGGWNSTPADVRSIDGHDERVPNQLVRLGEGSSIRLCSLYRRDLDRERSKT